MTTVGYSLTTQAFYRYFHLKKYETTNNFYVSNSLTLIERNQSNIVPFHSERNEEPLAAWSEFALIALYPLHRLNLLMHQVRFEVLMNVNRLSFR